MDELQKLLGPFPEKVDLQSEIIEQEDCGSYTRYKVAYNVEADERSMSMYVPQKIFKNQHQLFSVIISTRVILSLGKAK